MSGRHRVARPAQRARRLRIVVAVLGVAVLAGGSAYVATHHDPAPVVAEAPTTSLKDQLRASFDGLDTGVPVGVAIVPVGGGPAILLGDQSPPDAWSTIKIPLALAAERRTGENRSETKAIVDSDNLSARRLTRSLGTPDEAITAVTAILREGGDISTVVVPAEGGEWPHLGETVWPLDTSAAWTAHLPCLPGSTHVIDLMSHVGREQDWGLMRAGGQTTAVKGGWGSEDDDDSYLVRQIGLLTLDDDTRVAISMSTTAPGMTYETGVKALDTVGDWLGRNRGLLPGGSCPAPPSPEAPSTPPSTPQAPR
ncbi:hypothetical protein [Gordonia caeni]|uniref:Uncharacterized protein n=1 Tax=Gordonia caeni TaxID=1007097 RepID=A0ABP7PDZ1_9ACTN